MTIVLGRPKGEKERGTEDKRDKKIKSSLTNLHQQFNCAGERLTRNSRKIW